MKHSIFQIFTSIIAFGAILGCGHNRYNEHKSTGVGISIPFGDIGSLNICIGSAESSTAMVRGGSSISTESASGGGILSAAGGSSKITTIKFNEQLNEGNVVKVMVSPDVPVEAKVELAKAYASASGAPEFKPSALQTREAIIYSNGFTNQLDHPFQTTGIDRAVDNVSEVVNNAVDDVTTGAGHAAAAVVDTTRSVVNNVDSTVKKVVDNASITNKIRDTIIDGTANLGKTATCILLSIVLVVILCIIIFTRKTDNKKSKLNSPLRTPRPPDMMQDPNDTEDLRESMGIHVQKDPFSDPGEETVDADIDPENPTVPKKKWYIAFFDGLKACIKSLLGFWRSLTPEEQDYIKRGAQKIHREYKERKEASEK